MVILKLSKANTGNQGLFTYKYLDKQTDRHVRFQSLKYLGAMPRLYLHQYISKTPIHNDDGYQHKNPERIVTNTLRLLDPMAGRTGSWSNLEMDQSLPKLHLAT